MRVESINGKKYILIIVDDYSWFTWVKFLRSKDEAFEFIIKFLKMIQVRLNANVKNIRTDNGTECVNQTLRSYYEDVAYELLHDRKPDLSYLHVFGALCYPTNDSEDQGKLKTKADVGIVIGYAPAKKAYRIYNRRTTRIMETIHVNFDGLTAMDSEQSTLRPTLHEMTPGTLFPEVAALDLVVSTGTPSSTFVVKMHHHQLALGLREAFHLLDLDNQSFTLEGVTDWYQSQVIKNQELEAPKEALPSPDYVLGPEYPSSPDYMPGLEHVPSPIYVPYVPESEYSEYLVPSDAEAPIEDQPLQDDASPTSLSPCYIVDFDPEEDPADYPADERDDDDDDESSNDDDDDNVKEDEEEEHLALADFSVIPSPPLPVSSLPLPLPSPPTTSPTYVEAPLGYRVAAIRMRAASPPLLLPYTSHRTDIPEAEMPPHKKACFNTPDEWRLIIPSLLMLPDSRVKEIGYGITDTWDELVDAIREVAPTTLEGVNQRETRLAITVRQDTYEIYVNTHEIQIQTWDTRIQTLEALVATMVAQTLSLQTQLTAALRRIQTLEARDPEPLDGPADAGSSS
nr:hypothetical protein [Tanacetum cinerariifolium]